MGQAEKETAKVNVAQTLEKIKTIDAKILEFEEKYRQLKEMRTKGIIFCARNLKELNAEEREEALSETSPELADEISANMFSFEDLALLDKRDLQKVLFKCSTDDLAWAIKLLGNVPVKKMIYSNVSKNNLQLIREKETALGEEAAVDKKEVARIQRQIVDLAIKMYKDGEIVFPD